MVRRAQTIVATLAVVVAASAGTVAAATDRYDDELIGNWDGLYPLVSKKSPIPADPVRACEAGRCTILSRGEAKALGYTLVDFSDDWAPTIFQDGVDSKGRDRVNSFRQRFTDLANDRTDHDGDPLDSWVTNYLELYGIPPSLSMHLRRWKGDRERDCWADVDFEAIRAFEGRVRFIGKPKAWLERRARLRRYAKKKPDNAKIAADLDKAEKRVKMIHATQKRLKCEKIWSPFRKLRPGHEDRWTQEAVAKFERRNRIFGYGHIRSETLKALGTAPDELNHRTLIRVLGERIIDAAGIIEDGSVPGSRDLVGENIDAFAKAMGIDTPLGALEWFDRVVAFRRLTVGVKLPPKPPYYSDHMELRIEIDRGDIWYDLPYDARGRARRMKREKKPQLTVYVAYDGGEIPLVRWRTTIGAWRKEMLTDGNVYLKYKNSDVGPRVMRQVIAAPVWIPPAKTPLGELIKRKRDKKTKKREWKVNYDEMGPGYKSAYGLVAGYLLEHVCRRDGSKCWDRDHQIRIHGSSDYMSILARFSHGCHRLYNHLAVRMYNYVVRHRKHTVMGETPLDYERDFEYQPKNEDEPMAFKIEFPSRGFRYLLDPPLPVTVLEGNIKGKQEKRIQGYVRVKGVEYPADALVPPEGGDPRPPTEEMILEAEQAKLEDPAAASDPALRAAAAEALSKAMAMEAAAAAQAIPGDAAAASQVAAQARAAANAAAAAAATHTEGAPSPPAPPQ